MFAAATRAHPLARTLTLIYIVRSVMKRLEKGESI